MTKLSQPTNGRGKRPLGDNIRVRGARGLTASLGAWLKWGSTVGILLLVVVVVVLVGGSQVGRGAGGSPRGWVAARVDGSWVGCGADGSRLRSPLTSLSGACRLPAPRGPQETLLRPCRASLGPSEKLELMLLQIQAFRVGPPGASCSPLGPFLGLPLGWAFRKALIGGPLIQALRGVGAP